MKYITFRVYLYDINRYLKHSNTINIGDSEKKLIGLIIARYHVIEKGLTMPNMRYGFGKNVLITLISDCLTFYQKYETDNIQLRHAVGVIAEYKRVHEQNNIPIDNTVLLKINHLLSIIVNIRPTNQTIITKEIYFQDTYSSFDRFSESRHSIRNFVGNISKETIERAIALAQNAPSSCNRQPTRVYIIENRDIINRILSLQDGNRGFGYLANKLLVLSADVSAYIGKNERNLQYIDAGIYTMNLLYSLHFYQVGACTLNWSDTPEIDKEIREIINFSPSETIIIVIACGNVPDKFHLTLSKKNSVNQISCFKQ